MRTLQRPYCLVMEYMPNGCLRDFLLRADPDQDPDHEITTATILHMAGCIADVMAFLESHKLIHRDLAARHGDSA